MIAKVTGDRLRLVASIGFNLVSKSPSVLTLLFVLPIINQSLGTALYGEFLAMLALGSAFTLAFGGINIVARRELAAAYVANDPKREATAVWNGIFCSFIAALSAGTIVLFVSHFSISSRSLAVVAILPIATSLANTFDNIRAAYNQHYVTAIFQTVTQLAIYCPVIAGGLAPGSLILFGFVLQAPFILASALTFALLLWEKPHIRSIQKPQQIGIMLRSAMYVTLSDGAIFAALNASLYVLGAIGAVEIAAWYGTLTRAFQTLLTPVLLVMLPLSSFIAIRWMSWKATTRQHAIRVIAVVSLCYGLSAAFIMMSAGDAYLRVFFPSVPRFPFEHLVCLAIFFCAVLTQKLYTQLIYSVARASLLSIGNFAAVMFGFLVAMAASISHDPLRMIDLFAIGTGVPLLASIIADQIRRSRMLKLG